MIRKNAIMIESDHKIKTLFGSPRQKVGGGKWRARTHKTFYAAQNLKIIFFTHGFLQNSLRDFLFFHYFTHFDILKNALPIIEKSVCWRFKNQKSDMYILLVFPCPSSWYMTFFPISIRVWRQIGVENGPFLIFEKNQKSLKTFCKNPWLKKMIF